MRIIFSFIWVFLVTTTPMMAQTRGSECPDTQFTEWGMNGVVTPGMSNRLRGEPSTSGAVLGTLPAGEVFNVMYASSTCAEGYLWVEVRTLEQTGWTVERPIDEDEPFVIPYESPEPREIGQRLDDGSYLIDEGGLYMEIPASLDVEQVWLAERIGFFGNTMSAQPSSVTLSFINSDEESLADIQILPYAISETVRELYWDYLPLETLLTEQPDLAEYASRNQMPQAPIGGVAALFGGATIYLPFNEGMGLRYLTFFAQDWVLFEPDYSLTYLYRGLTNDLAFFIAGEQRGVSIPEGTIPDPVNRGDDALYGAYTDEFSANLNALPTSAFTPDLALIDTLMSSLTITDNDLLMALIP